MIEDQPFGFPGGSQVVIRGNDVECSRRTLEPNAETLAAVLIDPLSSRVGMVLPSPAFVAMLRAFCDRPRTGRWSDESGRARAVCGHHSERL